MGDKTHHTVEKTSREGLELKIPILMYHSVSSRPSNSQNLLSITSTTFASHLECLKSQGYSPLTVSSLISKFFDQQGYLPPKPVAITFDDGLIDFFTEALPLLNKFDFPATLYIPTALVNQSPHRPDPSGQESLGKLSWPEIREIADHGIECGSHSHTHAHLDVLPHHKMEEEVRISKDILEQQLYKNVETFSYPFGTSSPILRQIVRKAGYTSACAIRHSMTTLADDRYALARISITSNLSQERFQDFLMDKGLNRPIKDERVRTRIYRLVRMLKARMAVILGS